MTHETTEKAEKQENRERRFRGFCVFAAFGGAGRFRASRPFLHLRAFRTSPDPLLVAVEPFQIKKFSVTLNWTSIGRSITLATASSG